MTSIEPRRPRRHTRTPVEIDVLVNGVLNLVDGRIVDLSEGGAQIMCDPALPAKSRCEIQFAGQVTYAIVMWSEVDRMGVRFPYELTHGALFDALEAARNASPIIPSQIFRSAPLRAVSFGRRGQS